jgi:hypothetical protein
MKRFLWTVLFLLLAGCGGSGSSDTVAQTGSTVVKSVPLFAPFYPVGSENVDLNSSFAYSFIISDGSCEPHWDWAVDENISDFKDVVKEGMISFGGAGAEGKTLAYVCTQSNLLNVYRQIIDTYGIKRLDFDIEGGMLDENDANLRRFEALKELKKIYPDVNISLTLPVMPEGFDDSVKNLINMAKEVNLTITSYNLMLMDYGSSYPACDKNKTQMFEYSKAAIENVNEYLKGVENTQDGECYYKIGAVAMIGVNDVNSEIFYRNDFALLRDYVIRHQMPLLSFWSVIRDRAGTDIDTSSGLDAEDYGTMEYEYYNIGKISEFGFAGNLESNDTFYWQLNGDLKENIPADIYDVDLFDVSADTVANLKKSGKTVVCYMNAGVWEGWREDAYKFPESVKGNDKDGSSDEKWIDIRSENVRDIMQERMDLAKEKGCDGIEPGNIDGYENDTGFALTYDDQLAYNIFLSREAKKRGLLTVMRNDLDQADELVNYYDFLLAEKAVENNETDKFLPFIIQNKPVYDVEYNSSFYECSKAENFHLLLLSEDLNGSVVESCDYGNY